jgi:hypothetical protein
MPSSKVVQVIKHDHWASSKGEIKVGPFVLRFRTPVLAPTEVLDYPQRLSVLWVYAAENTGAMPDEEDTRRMERYENLLIDALEGDYQAVLTAVITLDGARQWIFYTGDDAGCRERIGAIPAENAPYPVELSSADDPQWEFLRKQILGGIAYEAHQPLWWEALEARSDT